MNQLPTACPICQSPLVIQKIHCRECETTLMGNFEPVQDSEFDEQKLPILRRFAKLSVEQLNLLEAFIRCEGKLNRLQAEVNLSYPTLRSRLDEIVQDLGFTPSKEEKVQVLNRRQILNDLQTGKISADEATRLLRASQE